MKSNKLSLNKLFSNIKTSDDNSLVNDDQIEQYIFLIMGEPQVGKSSFCMRFAFDNYILEIKESQKTECYMKKIEIVNKEINVVLIDVASSLKDKNILTKLCHHIKGAIIMYDITSKKSFDKLDFWINELQQLTAEQQENKIPVFFVGNKADLQFLRIVDKEIVLATIDNFNYNFGSKGCNQLIYEYDVKEVNGIDNNVIQDYMNLINKNMKNMYEQYTEDVKGFIERLEQIEKELKE